MFIACKELFKIGIGPSSSHTMGPMLAALRFRQGLARFLTSDPQLFVQSKNHSQSSASYQIHCELFGSLAYTGKGHATDRAVTLGLHGFSPAGLADKDVMQVIETCQKVGRIHLDGVNIEFSTQNNIHWNKESKSLTHPNTLSFACCELSNGQAKASPIYEERFVSIGGGFVCFEHELDVQELNIVGEQSVPYPFSSADQMLTMAQEAGLSISELKRANELSCCSEERLSQDIVEVWQAMRACIERGIAEEGCLPGSLNVSRRAKGLYRKLVKDENSGVLSHESSDWLSVYAMAVNEENAAGHMVVTAPTNGAAGVIPAVLYYVDQHVGNKGLTQSQIETFFLTASAIGGLIKHNSSISGAEVGCQGEVGSASAMAAAGLCALKGGTPKQVEHAAEIALEHHLGMTCDPIAGLVQVPCIERNAFGAVKAWLAVSLALRETSEHLMSLDACIAAMHQTGLEMSDKYKETSLGGLAASWVEC